jgi:hypothetical protein
VSRWPARTLEERFMEKVEKTEDGCWLWLASLDARGYGQFRRPEPPHIAKAHRVSYELHVGPIPEGLTLDHLCRVRHCVNPDHLEPVTNRENILRGESFTAQQARQTHCVRGHEFTPENTHVWRGHRGCRACDRQDRPERRRRERARAEAA